MGTEHRTIMRSTEKENFLDHIKNLAFGRGQPLPRALWDPKTKRFTISILIQQLKICHASLAWCSLICCQPNAITKIVFNLIWSYWILHFAFCVYIPYCILHTDYIAQPSSVAVETSNPGWIRAMWQPLNHWENLVCGNTLFKSKIDVEYQKNTFCLWHWEGIERLRTGFFSRKGWILQHGVHFGK